jgi:hypothetical protein
MAMDASLFAPAQPMLRMDRNASNDSTPRRSAGAPMPDNVVVPGFVPPSRDPLAQQLPPTRPGWSGAESSGERMPPVPASRRNRLARASFVFTGVALFAAGAALLRLDAGDTTLAGVASALAVVLLVLSCALAIGGVVLAVRGQLPWWPAVLALVLGVSALAGALYLAAGQVLDLSLPLVA